MKLKKLSGLLSAVLAGAMVLSMAPAAFAATTAKCNHIINQAAVDNGDGTCSYICIKCQAIIDTTPHVWDEDGTCVRCDAKKPVCDHVNQYAVDNHNGTCSYVCKDCNAVIDTQAHVYYDGETKCARCGAEKPVEPVITFTPVDATHHRVHTVLADGSAYDTTVACNFDNGTCVCGNVKGNVKPVCDHVNQYAVDNHNGTCSYVCKDCNAVIDTQAHVYYDGETKCARCGAEKPACDHMKNNWKYVNNGNSTHNVVCADCGAVVSANVACNYENGVCITCGAKQPAATKPGHGTIDPNFGVGYHPICEFFRAVFRFLFGRH